MHSIKTCFSKHQKKRGWFTNGAVSIDVALNIKHLIHRNNTFFEAIAIPIKNFLKFKSMATRVNQTEFLFF